jgi:hypothetical protein
MAILNTSQGLPYPDNNERLADVPDFIYALADALDDKILGVYASQAALSGAGPFEAGRMAWVTADNTLQVYTGSTWVTVYPASPRIFSGTAVPSSSLGSNGDLYVRY